MTGKEKHKKKEPAPAPPVRRRRPFLFGGIGLLLLAFTVLTRTDSAGANWAGTLSPFLFVLSWISIGYALWEED